MAMGTGLLALWISTTWSTRLTALLIGAFTVRCSLKPAEVRVVRDVRGPLGTVLLLCCMGQLNGLICKRVLLCGHYATVRAQHAAVFANVSRWRS